MNDMKKLVQERRSVRTYDGHPLTEPDKEKLCAYMKTIENPYGIPIEFLLLEGMGCPVVVGTELYVGAKMNRSLHLNEAFGYSFEQLVLYAQFLGIGTVWIGGTMDRATFEKAMQVDTGEIMPCVSPLGYPAKKMSLRETMMRKSIKADERMAFEKICYEGDFNHPLTKETAGKLYLPLEMVRLAPSAVNKQPWRMVVADNMVHFYLQRSKGFGSGEIDMQKIDIGIAMCHFALMTQELGLNAGFLLSPPDIPVKDSMEYIASYQIK